MSILLDSLGYVPAICILALTAPVLLNLAKNKRPEKPAFEDGLYEDRDGVASIESMAKFSNRRPFVLSILAAAVGVAASLTLSIYGTVREVDEYGSRFWSPILGLSWISFPAWLGILIQVIDASRERHPAKAFAYVIYIVPSALLSAVHAMLMWPAQLPPNPQNVIFVVAAGAQILAEVVLFSALFAVKRRPDVFRPDGRVVDRQFTGSMWSRWSLSWADDLLSLAGSKLIQPEELSALDADVRSQDTTRKFQDVSLKQNLPIWRLILWSYIIPILDVWWLVSFSCITDFAPQFAVMRLLQYLEVRRSGDPLDPYAWYWAFVLLAVSLASAMIDSRVMWRMWSDLAIPVRSTVSTLIFEKMMRVKDCKEPPQEEKKSTDESAEDPDAGNKDKPEAPKKGRNTQNMVNMFSIDANTIGMFACNSQLYCMFAIKIVLACWFLLYLVGWESLLAGLASAVVVWPINKSIAVAYQKWQKELMTIRDKKTAVVTEALNGVRQIKFSGIEEQWGEKIFDVRNKELEILWKTKMTLLLMNASSNIAPVILTVFSFTTYSFVYGRLQPSVAFTALSLFIQLEGILQFFPYLMTLGVNAKVSADRVDEFLRSPELPVTTYPGESVTFTKTSVAFPSDAETHGSDRFVLRNLDLAFPNGGLSVISGPTGSGKSLLLSAITGEADVLSGYIHVPVGPSTEERHDDKATAANWILPTAMAFVGQTPWIENATIKDNILFGLPFDEVRYNKVIKSCALTTDLKLLDDGDLTEVGAQGITLSGGQKWRLTLARAFYSRAGILVLDDVFSALDAHVGKEIYKNALMGELAEGRTRILVTHHVSLVLPRADYVIRLTARGVLEHAGLVSELRSTGELEHIVEAAEEEEEGELAHSNGNGVVAEIPEEANGNGAAKKPAPPPKKLIEDEKREEGGVKRGVYTRYLGATGGIPFWVMVLALFAGAQALIMGRSWWIRIWSAGFSTETAGAISLKVHNLYALQLPFDAHKNVTIASLAAPTDGHSLGYYISGYLIISAVSVVVAVIRYYFVYWGSIRASKDIFQSMTYSVLHTPMRWLDTVPVGRILNRFTADFQAMDSQLSSNFASLGSQFFIVVGIIVASFLISPLMILLAVILILFCGRVGYRYIKGARSVKRLDSTQKSPVISHFSAAFTGLGTIRAYAKTPVFSTRMYNLIDNWAAASWHMALFNNWVEFRMSIFGSFFCFAVAAFVVWTTSIDAGLAGFALAFALDYRYTVMMTVRLLANTELDMNAAERIFEYTNLESEKTTGIDNLRASWPEEGKLEVKDLVVGYAEGLPDILKGLTFSAEKHERIGVVGRTGAGKSTLSLALFRFLEARSGCIMVDGVDVSTIKLHDLRTRLAIIPQDPVLFSGTIRSNLDPFDQLSDYQLTEALKLVHLIPSADNTPLPEPATGTATPINEEEAATNQADDNVNIFTSLSTPVSSGGANLSQGQKQLLCLARAILSRPKVLILDEATSAVDMVTDQLIQRTIREEFSNTTLLVVAHRLSTVADFDKILVMQDGKAGEFGSPRELLETGEVFKGLVGESGEKEELEKTILA